MCKIGKVKATSLVAGNMIGSGVLIAPAILAPYGSMSIVGWILTTIGAIALALVFAKLSSWVPKSGGPYTFARHVFGDFIGFQMAWGYWISTWCGSVSLLVCTLQYISIFCPDFVANQMLSICLGIFLICLFTCINLRGIKESTCVEVVIVAIKIVPIVVIAILGLCCVDITSVFKYEDFQKHGISSFGLMAQTLLWAFIGLESATIPSDKVDNPSKTIPLATIAGVLITASVYIFGAIAINGLVPESELLVSKAPYVDAAKKIFGEPGAVAMIITGIIGIAGSLNGWILIQGQVSYSAAQEGLFPKYFLKTNKNNVPSGVVVGSILMTIVFLLSYQPACVKQINNLINVSVFAMLLPYFYSVVAYMYLLIRKNAEIALKEKIYLYIVSFVAFIYTFISIVGGGYELVFIGFTMFLISVPFYCFVKKQ